MPTFNEGIRTVEGENLFNRVKNGYTDIHYTRIVFSSLDLSGKSDNDISQLTDVQPQELSVKTQTVSDTQDDGETDIRAIATNEPLTAGVNINTYALYAMDDQKREVLFGVAVDNHPSYLPAHAPGEQIQYLTYDWTSSIKDTNKIELTDPNDVIVTYDEFNRYRNSLASSATSYHNSLSASASGANSALSMSAEGGIDGNGQRTEVVSSQATSYTNSAAASLTSVINTNSGNASGSAQSVMNQANANMETNRANLQNSINGLPNWFDMNWTRNTMIPSGAASAANAANNYTNGKIGSLADVVGANSANASSSAQSVMNQANANMENNRVSLSNSVNGLPHWWDENWTRNNVAPSLANSARDAANGYTNQQTTSLNGRVQSNENNKLFDWNAKDVASVTNDMNELTTPGKYFLSNHDNIKNCPLTDQGAHVIVENFMGDIVQKVYSTWHQTAIVRDHANGNWYEWKQIAYQDAIDDLNSRADNLQNQIYDSNNQRNSINSNLQNRISSDENNPLFDWNSKDANDVVNDLNDLTKSGKYQIPNGTSIKHNPCSWAGAYLWVYTRSFDTVQKVFNTWNNVEYVRSNSGSGAPTGWKPWKRLLSDDDFNNLQNQINGKPNWVDVNWTRNNVAPSLATNAMNQAIATANANMETNRSNLQGQLDNNKLFDWNSTYIPEGADMNSLNTPGCYVFNKNVKNGASIMYNSAGYVRVFSYQFDKVQVVISTWSNSVAYRVNSGGRWFSWHDVGNIGTAANEDDARNKSNQNPGELYIYSD